MIQLKVRYPQNILSRGFVELFRTGPWNGIGFSGRPNLKPDTIFRYEVVYTEEVVYYHYELLSSVVSRFALSHNGVVERWIWIDRTQEWVLYSTGPTDTVITINYAVRTNQTEWGNGYWSNGCVRRTPLDCHNGDGFVKCSGYKMPHLRNSWFDRNMTLRECKISSRVMMIFDLHTQSETTSFFAMDTHKVTSTYAVFGWRIWGGIWKGKGKMGVKLGEM
ncbi:hypothetical protein ACSBR2_011965 [Camellia fascicularis]